MRRTLAIGAFLSLSACSGQLPVVGLDENGKTIETMIQKTDYVSHLRTSVGRLSESTIPVLDSYNGRKQWYLREARLGLGLKGEVGIGEYFKLGGNIGFRLGFTNSKS